MQTGMWYAGVLVCGFKITIGLFLLVTASLDVNSLVVFLD